MLFQVAGTIGIATKNNHSFAFPKMVNYDHKERFGSSEECEVWKFFENQLPEVPEIEFQDMFIHWGYHDVSIHPDARISLEGHMQSDKYFEHCMDTVRHYMRMKDEPPQTDYVAIHYRAGDYEDDPNAYHPRCSREYYQQAMSLFPGAKFLIFSDNVKEAAERIKDFGDCRVFVSSSYIEDFKMMKKCKHFITANSSYSLMAAILGEHPEKQIVCPKRWFGPVAGITFDGLYPKNATVI